MVIYCNACVAPLFLLGEYMELLWAFDTAECQMPHSRADLKWYQGYIIMYSLWYGTLLGY